jgi:hypothetical protein
LGGIDIGHAHETGPCWKLDGQSRTLSGSAFQPHRSLQMHDALAGTDQTETVPHVPALFDVSDIETDAVIFNRDQNGIRQPLQIDTATGRLRVLRDVG